MTTRIKISHLEPESTFKLTVTNNYDNIETVIQPGGSAEFFVHRIGNVTGVWSKELTIKEKKSGETEASPS